MIPKLNQEKKTKEDLKKIRNNFKIKPKITRCSCKDDKDDRDACNRCKRDEQRKREYSVRVDFTQKGDYPIDNDFEFPKIASRYLGF